MTAPSLFLPVSTSLPPAIIRLLRPVVPEIGTNRSRAKIDIVSDDGIPGITQMRNKRPVPHNAILQLNALPHNTPVSQRNISPQIAIRTNPATVSHPYAAFHHHAGQHCGIPPKPQGSHNMRAVFYETAISFHSPHHSLLPVQQIPRIYQPLHGHIPFQGTPPYSRSPLPRQKTTLRIPQLRIPPVRNPPATQQPPVKNHAWTPPQLHPRSRALPLPVPKRLQSPLPGVVRHNTHLCLSRPRKTRGRAFQDPLPEK